MIEPLFLVLAKVQINHCETKSLRCVFYSKNITLKLIGDLRLLYLNPQGNRIATLWKFSIKPGIS